MADGGAPYESGGAGEKFCKRLFRPGSHFCSHLEINEDAQNDSQEAVRNNSTGVSEHSTHEGGNYASISAAIGISELEEILKQKTFTRSEIQQLIELLHSRMMEEFPSDTVPVERDGSKPPPPPASPVIRVEASGTTSGSMNRHKHGDESHNFHAAGFISSRVAEEDVASPAELAKAYKGSTSGTGEPLRQNPRLNYIGTCLPKTLMASPQHPTTMEHLPEELLSNIFIRLLAKQLAQMRSVSKSWNSLLSQSSFIKSHLHHSMHIKDRILLAFYDEESSTYSMPFTAHTCRPAHPELTNPIKLPANPHFENANVIRVIGAVNGSICYSPSDSVIQIWNPSLLAVLTLPPYSMPSHGFNSIKIYFRFVYNPKTDDYKVVKLTGLAGPITYVIKWWLQIEIYSMRKGTWELITERFPLHITTIFNGDHMCSDGHDGHLHRLGSIYEKSKSERIVAFDSGSETFSEMPLPESTLNHCGSNELGVLSGKLCVMSWGGDVGCEVWVMEEYGVPESWVKRHVFPFTGFIGFTSHNEFVVVDDGYIFLEDLVSNEETVLEKCCDGRGGPDTIVEYVDSLVWVAPDKRQMVDGASKNCNLGIFMFLD